VASRNDELWEQVSAVLAERPGWTVQDSPTPGVDPLWAFSPHIKVDYSVCIEGGLLHVYEEKTDREVQFGTVEELTAWLDANPATARTPGAPSGRQPRMRWR
jgi:hypothetical protein